MDDSNATPMAAGLLMDGLLGSLLVDFEHWFARGQVLLTHCPEAVMAESERQALASRLSLAAKELAATRSIRAAAPTSLVLEIETLAPWHRLVLDVWNLSSRLRLAQIELPPQPPSPPLRAEPENQGLS